MRAVILGSSPNREITPNLHRLILDSTVYGVNRTMVSHYPLDHWVVWDTHDMLEDAEMRRAFKRLGRFGGTAWFRERNDTLDGRLPFPHAGNNSHIQYFQEVPQGEPWKVGFYQTHRLKLPCRGSVCTTAAALAYFHGADEIWLVGVDFATPGPTPDWTRETLKQTAIFVNEFFEDFPIPVYKTFNGGPLNVEYKEYWP